VFPALDLSLRQRDFCSDRRRLGILQAELASALGLHYLCGKIRIMARKKANYPLIEGLEITTLAAEGKAMGRWNDVVVFVPLTVPGDVVDVQIRSKRRRFMEGFVVRYVKKSPLRAEAFCEHFGVCGGCKWQNLPYEEQLRFKTGQVRDQLARIGKIALPEIAPCLGSARTQFYRNKLEFTFADRRWLTREEVEGGADIGAAPALGFHIPGMFDKVLDIRKCWLQPDPSNDIRMETKRFCVENGYTFHNAREHTGLMRNMIVRTASTGEVMVTVVFGADDRERIAALLDHLAAAFPQITSLCYVVNTKLNDSVGDLDPVCYKGKDHIVEEMEGLRFKVGPKSFYQTNSEQAYELYKVAREFADLKPEDVLYDLYTGTGTIANFCAAHCRRVVGIEYVPEAIADAKINSEINGIGNTVFYAGDMKQVLSDEFVAANGRPDVIILDPPRAGVDEPVIGVILRAAPERIVYVSCNPATQARDLALLDADYRVEAVQPVDMFPHTHHVENVVKLVRR
jgi:23S rRNA (uracil-5-)-methyltransferase rumA